MDQVTEFFSNHLILSVSLLIILFMIISLEFSSLMSKFKSLTHSELTNLINKHKITLIDFRTTEDYTNGHIINSVNLNIDSINKKEFDKNLPIVTYSDNENDSIKAAKEYVKLGYQTVYYLQGGIRSWTENNMPLSGEKSHGK